MADSQSIFFGIKELAPDCYETLGLGKYLTPCEKKRITPDQIRAAYLRRSLTTPSDKTDNISSDQAEVNAAYETLSSAGKREEYDRQRSDREIIVDLETPYPVLTIENIISIESELKKIVARRYNTIHGASGTLSKVISFVMMIPYIPLFILSAPIQRFIMQLRKNSTIQEIQEIHTDLLVKRTLARIPNVEQADNEALSRAINNIRIIKPGSDAALNEDGDYQFPDPNDSSKSEERTRLFKAALRKKASEFTEAQYKDEKVSLPGHLTGIAIGLGLYLMFPKFMIAFNIVTDSMGIIFNNSAVTFYHQFAYRLYCTFDQISYALAPSKNNDVTTTCEPTPLTPSDSRIKNVLSQSPAPTATRDERPVANDNPGCTNAAATTTSVRSFSLYTPAPTPATTDELDVNVRLRRTAINDLD